MGITRQNGSRYTHMRFHRSSIHERTNANSLPLLQRLLLLNLELRPSLSPSLSLKVGESPTSTMLDFGDHIPGFALCQSLSSQSVILESQLIQECK